MTYKSDKQPDRQDESLANQVVEQLDAAEQTLSEKVVQDIAQARTQALQQARMAKAQKEYGKTSKGSSKHFPFWAVGTPAAVALVALVLVSYGPNQAIPELPVELLMGDITTEDLALLNDMELTQDLEFADWLAQQNEEALL